MAKNVLGKGLEALLGDIAKDQHEEVKNERPELSLDGGVLEVPLQKLDPNRNQPRKQFDDEKLRELADSIERQGVIQPLIVRKNGDRYTIVAGERRWRAARLTRLKTLPVLVRDYNDSELMEIALIENLQRTDLNPIEEAAGYKLLIDQHDLTQEEVGERVGKSRSAIANALRLLTLPQNVLTMIREGSLSSGHARCLAGLNDAKTQTDIANMIVAKGLSVRQTEALCKSARETRRDDKSPARALEPALFDVQSKLQDKLETKVKIAGNIKRGRIIIEYYSEDQLESIYDYLKG